MSNRATGTRFEQELCELLAEHGFWAHNLTQNQAGQPADIIAVKGNYAVLIDCKVCSTNSFRLSRIEENQEMAMLRWYATGNDHSYFALKMLSGEIYMMPSKWALGQRSCGVKTIRPCDHQWIPCFWRWAEGFQ